MGADKKFAIKKFGNILINLKTTKKSKVYVFNCEFCNTNCDQLKKFSQHLDEKHSEQFSEENLLTLPREDEEGAKQLGHDEDIKDDLGVFEPEVKVEDLLEFEGSATGVNEEDKKGAVTTKEGFLNQDPLEMREDKAKRPKISDIEIKSEHIDDESEDDCGDDDFNICDFNCNAMDYEDSIDDSESDEGDYRNTKSKELTVKTKKEFVSDVSSDDSKDSDFKIDREMIKQKRKYVKKASKIIKKEDDLKIDEKELIPAILESFRTQSILWEVKYRSHDKAIRQNAFQSIAKDVNEKMNIQMKWQDIRKRIQYLRDSYSREYEKQIKGEKHQMPWYTEHMKFLEENIKYLIKHRHQKKKYRRLSKLDESHIPLYIEYYKNCEVLWQINNIAFVVKPKKSEALKTIADDIKSKHNIDVNVYDVKRRFDYINRIYSSDRERQLQCEIENIEFVPSSKFYNDLSFLSESQGPFKCSHCNEIIYKFETYHKHIAEHTKTVPFKCALCEMRFNKLHKYIVHAKRHLGINNYHCDFCGKGYPFRSELDWHVRQHTGEEPYLCEICGASFRARHGYDNHIRRHENRFRYECHICKYGFNHLHALNAHVKAHLNIRDILCNVCGKGFTAKKHLLRHQQIHSDVKRYKCAVCGKAFAQDAGLRAHRKQHLDYTPISEKGKKKDPRKGNYNCGFCDVNCDQLKKFSLHLDEKHNNEIWEEPIAPCENLPTNDDIKAEEHCEPDIKTDLDVLEPKVKIEEFMELQAPSIGVNEGPSKMAIVTKEESEFEDPLETGSGASKCQSPYVVADTIKKECDENFVDEDMDVVSFNCEEIDYEDSVDESESEEETTRGMRRHKSKKVYSSDMSSDDSQDFEYRPEREKTKTKRVYRKMKALRNEILKMDPKVLTIAILEAFEKQPLLWKVGAQSQDKVIRQNAFEAIARDASDKLQVQLTCEYVRKRIKEIRNEYCQIRIKQREGEQCENPWYTDYTKFLEENIKALVSNRRKRNRRLKTMDESRLKLFIEYYRNCETLWKVDTITFVLKSKRIEALESITNDLKAKHNIQQNKFDVQRSLEYINHLYSVDRERQLKCELNKTEFVPSSKYYHQLSFLRGCQGPFMCSHCNEIINKYENYHQHVAEHTKIVPFKCALCEMRFSKLTKYVLHAKRHLGLYDYNCKFCSKGYAVRTELDLHERQHTGEEPFLCDICGTSFKSRDCYNNHKLRHENRFRYECHICKQGFNHKPSLRDHIKIHLNIRDILCNICGKGFATRRYLLHHQLIHSETKRYKCRVCGKAFAQGAGMRAHQKLHK